MSPADRVRGLVDPIVLDVGVELVDVVYEGGVLRVTIDKDGGVGIDEISKVTRALSRALDEADPISGRYTLEVSSPGLERPLRTPDHFRRAVGQVISLKTVAHVEGDRRAKGLLAAADDDGITLRDEDTLAERTIRFDQIEKARTVFEWGPAPKPGAGRNQRKKASTR